MSVLNKLDEQIKTLTDDARDFYLRDDVEQLEEPPSALDFYRSYAAANLPVLIRNGLNHWPALKKWSPDYLREKIGDLDVTVAVTPNGYADAVADGKFVLPEERQMPMRKFLDILSSPKDHNGIFYIQKQNSNLTDEFSAVMGDVESELEWGTKAFGMPPDAVNFWMGDGRATTSMHRDHYENLYCVVRGWKKFTLIPPTDRPYVPYEDYPTAVYKENQDGVFELKDVPENGMVPWVAIDPLCPDLERFPQYGNARPVTVTVREGEILYLPALWFHHVQQSHGCIAVNYWYDMQFDIKYVFCKFLGGISKIKDGNSVQW